VSRGGPPPAAEALNGILDELTDGTARRVLTEAWLLALAAAGAGGLARAGRRRGAGHDGRDRLPGRGDAEGPREAV